MRNLIDRFIPRYSRKYLIACGITQLLAYFCTKLAFTGEYVDLSLTIDHAIPLEPVWIIVYVGSYIFWIVGYIAISRAGREHFMRLFYADCTAKIICTVCFLCVPTMMERPDITVTGPLSWALDIIYRLDKPVNLFPSMHCLFSWMLARQITGMREFRPAARWAALVCALIVFPSTVFTRQHYVVDIPAGIAVAEIAILAARIIEKRRRISADR